MNAINIESLRHEERVALVLKSLFRSYGYGEYKLTGFEDYSLYAENKSFLDGNGVLSFSIGGKLLALRPDVTLSVVKNICALGGGSTEKLFYDERVYRKAAGGGEFSELRQIGVEVVGEIDCITETEICALSLKTLAAVSVGKYILCVSHAGIIEKVLNAMGLTGEQRKKAVSCLESKNAHDFSVLAARSGIDKSAANAFTTLINLPSDLKLAIAELGGLVKTVNITEELNELKNSVISSDCINTDCIKIDFSIGGDSDYYNGIVLNGYVEGVPYAVLSGGRYDRLLNKFGKKGEAIGFALYLGELCAYFKDVQKQADAIVMYDNDTATAAYKKAERLRAEGLNVLLSRYKDGFVGKVYSAKENDYD